LGYQGDDGLLIPRARAAARTVRRRSWRRLIGAAALAVAGFGCGRPSGPVETVDLLAPPMGGELLRSNATVDLGADDPDTQAALLGGWSWREQGWGTSFAWVDSQRAELRFFSVSGDDTAVRFRARPVPAGGAPQRVRVSVNGHLIGALQMQSDWVDYELTAPAAVVQRGLNTLEFAFDALEVPPHDSRHLAAAFDTVHLAPSSPVAPAAAASGALSPSGRLQLSPGNGVRFMVGIEPSASLALTAACGGASDRAARLHVWLGDDSNGDEPATVFDRPICSAAGANDTAEVNVPLPTERAGTRELYVVYDADAGAPPLQLDRLALTRPVPHATPERPNVLLVVLDALRADHLHAYGYERQTSPSLDALAAQGILFADAVAQGGQTITSVPSILTGTYPPEHGASSDRALGSTLPTLPAVLAAHGYATVAVSANPFFGPDFGLTRGFTDFYPLWTLTSPHVRGLDGVVRAESVIDAASGWLKRGREPFFMVLHFMQPHTPYAPPAPFRDWIAASTDGFEGQESELRAALAKGLDSARTLRAAAIDRYDENIRYVDDAVGRLMHQLQLLGLLERTVVIVMADHGEQFLEHGRFVHPANSLYDESLHVPLVIRLPGMAQPRRIDVPVETTDVAATVLDLAHLEPSLGHGRSLVPLFDGSQPADRPVLAFARHAAGEPTFDVDAVRLRALKLIRRGGSHPPELYDLDHDPTEQTSIASARPDAVAELSAVVDASRAALPAAAVAPHAPALDAGTREQLRALGYLRDGE
jgi:arylsulfatase A-like enzyme